MMMDGRDLGKGMGISMVHGHGKRMLQCENHKVRYRLTSKYSSTVQVKGSSTARIQDRDTGLTVLYITVPHRTVVQKGLQG